MGQCYQDVADVPDVGKLWRMEPVWVLLNTVQNCVPYCTVAVSVRHNSGNQLRSFGKPFVLSTKTTTGNHITIKQTHQEVTYRLSPIMATNKEMSAVRGKILQWCSFGQTLHKPQKTQDQNYQYKREHLNGSIYKNVSITNPGVKLDKICPQCYFIYGTNIEILLKPSFIDKRF